MTNPYDLIVIGSGPGGYVAAIRAAQLGMQVAVVEKEALGGVCLNWGCIPTKALLKSASLFQYFQRAADYGIQAPDCRVDFPAMIQRSRTVAATMHKGVQHLLQKHKIAVIKGWGKLAANKTVSVTAERGVETVYPAQHVVLATGSRARALPHLPIDGSLVVGYREALSLATQPRSIIVVGGGAIGCEFAYFYRAIGTKVALVEYMPRLLPLEDEEVSNQLLKSFVKQGMEVYTHAEVTQVRRKEGGAEVQLRTQAGPISIESDLVLSAVGIEPNLEGIGLEENGVVLEAGKIAVDNYYRTSCAGVYAIGDVVRGPALAHVASAEAIVCVEKIAGLNPEPLDYRNVPACTYTQPEVASVGYTENEAISAGYKIKIGKFPFAASGKAHALGNTEGFVKVVFDAQSGEWLGAHMVGANVTETIAEVVVARKLETTAHEIQTSVHPHPTLSEALLEAVAAAYGESIHF